MTMTYRSSLPMNCWKNCVTPRLLGRTRQECGKKERGHTYTLDNGGADRLVAGRMKHSESARKPFERLEMELGV